VSNVFRKDFSMRQISSKVFLYLGLFLVIFLTPIVPAVQGKVAEVEETGDEEIVATREATYSENTADVVLAGTQKQEITSIYTGLAVSIAEDYLDVYEQADEQSEIAGRLFEENVAEVIEGDSEWTLIVSGGLVGYVETAYLCFDEEAAAIGGDMTATVTSEYANVFTEAGMSDVIYTLDNGDELNTLGMCGDYMLVETEAGEGYVVNADVALNYNLAFGKTTEEIEAEEEAAAEAARLAEEAKAAKIAAAMQDIEITYNPTMTLSDEEVWMLACVVDWEAPWEPYEGKLAVANVVLNRLRSSTYANTMAGVIYARAQFSGVSDGAGGPSTTFQNRLNAGPRNSDCLKAAMEALSGTNNIGDYTAFRASYAIALETLPSFTIIGSHVFY
jgi:spore germination cell wall hydrolase CwlJ-like protein